MSIQKHSEQHPRTTETGDLRRQEYKYTANANKNLKANVAAPTKPSVLATSKRQHDASGQMRYINEKIKYGNKLISTQQHPQIPQTENLKRQAYKYTINGQIKI